MHDNCGGCGWTCSATGGFLPWWVRLLLVAGAAAGMTKLAVLVGKGWMVAAAVVATGVVVTILAMAIGGAISSTRYGAWISESWTAMDAEDQAASVPLEEYDEPDNDEHEDQQEDQADVLAPVLRMERGAA